MTEAPGPGACLDAAVTAHLLPAVLDLGFVPEAPAHAKAPPPGLSAGATFTRALPAGGSERLVIATGRPDAPVLMLTLSGRLRKGRPGPTRMLWRRPLTPQLQLSDLSDLLACRLDRADPPRPLRMGIELLLLPPRLLLWPFGLVAKGRVSVAQQAWLASPAATDGTRQAEIVGQAASLLRTTLAT